MKNIGNIKNKNIETLLNSSNIYYEGGGKTLNNIIYPVGAVIIRVDSTNPTMWYGGTWELLCPGKTLVCIDTSDSDFNTVKKTGGSKYLQSHNHNIWSAAGSKVTLAYGSGGSYNKVGLNYTWSTYPDNDADINTTNVNNLTTGNSGNLQPYMVVYIWVRTA